MEALVRSQRPLHGLVSPEEFIPLSEETGLILSLAHWVLECACNQLALCVLRPEFAHLTISVNVSARQFHEHDFVHEVRAVLDRTRADPRLLTLELTESLMVCQMEYVITQMGELKRLGVRFSLYDFRTCY